MKRTALIILVLFFCTSAFAQSWSPETIAAANTAADADYLSKEEKNMILYLNLIRTDGTLFFNTYFKEFVAQNNRDMQKYSNYKDLKIETRSRYYRSLEEDLKKIKGLPLLKPDQKLCRVSTGHANDLNKHNLVSHNSSNGDSFYDRISKAYPRRSAAENLAFGSATGLQIMCALLLDQNVPDLGHRKNILNNTARFTHVGVSIKPHPYYRVNAVMDFIGLN